MDVSSANNKSYNRAVTASVEGHLRQDKDHQSSELTQKRPEHVDNKRASEARSSDKKRSDERVNNDRQQRLNEVNAKKTQQQDSVKNAEKTSAAAALIGEKMKVSRQARDTQTSRRYVPPPLTSHRGHRANQSYLSASEHRGGRMIDEMI